MRILWNFARCISWQAQPCQSWLWGKKQNSDIEAESLDIGVQEVLLSTSVGGGSLLKDVPFLRRAVRWDKDYGISLNVTFTVVSTFIFSKSISRGLSFARATASISIRGARSYLG